MSKPVHSILLLLIGLSTVSVSLCLSKGAVYSAEKHQLKTQEQHATGDGQPPQIAQSPLQTTRIVATSTNENNPRTKRKQDNSADEALWWQSSVLSSWALVVVGLAYTVVAYFQLRAISRQADIADKIMSREKIPFVFLNYAVEGATAIGNGRMPRVDYGFRNYGTTPAFIREQFVEYSVSERLRGGPYYPRKPSIEPMGFVLGANDNTVHAEVTLGQLVAATEHDSLLQGQPGRNLFFYGFVTYSDIFGRRHTTGFALIHDPSTQALRLATDDEAPGYNYHRDEPYQSPGTFWQSAFRVFQGK